MLTDNEIDGNEVCDDTSSQSPHVDDIWNQGAPKCPKCGDPLDRVNGQGKSLWDYEEGLYQPLHNEGVTLTCPNCGACLDKFFGGDIFYWTVEYLDKKFKLICARV